MERRQFLTKFELGKYYQKPIAPGHFWPRTARGSLRTVLGAQAITVEPPMAKQLGPTYDESNSDKFRSDFSGDRERSRAKKSKTDVDVAGDRSMPPIGDPGGPGDGDEERVPLCTIEDLQDMLLMQVREGKTPAQIAARKCNGGDGWMVRTRPRTNRMPGDPLTPEKMVAFLEALEDCGGMHRSCQRSRCTYNMIRSMQKALPEFDDMVKTAMERYREKLEKEAYRRGVTGWEENVFGGRNKDRVVGTIRKYDSKMLELMLKRHIPDYRDKFEGSVNVTGGVLVVPSQTLDIDQWKKEHGGEREIIDEAPAKRLPR